MKLKILNIDEFIIDKKVKEVTSFKQYIGSSRDKFTPNGLFGEEIFGRIGSNERKYTYGFINLKTKLIHPEVYNILVSTQRDLTKLIKNTATYTINAEGILVAADDDELGDDPTRGSGIHFFIENFDKINFENLPNIKTENIAFIKTTRLFTDKILVLPAGIRDVTVNEKTNKTIYQYSEVTDKYMGLLRYTSMVPDNHADVPGELLVEIVENIQHIINDINAWIKQRLRGKHGVIRGGLLSKVVDFSGRMVIVPDNNLQLGFIGLPWHYVLKLHSPFVIHDLLNTDHGQLVNPLILKFMSAEEMSTQLITKFLDLINEDPKLVDASLKDELKLIAERITKDRVIIYKRDPTENRDSWIACYVRIDDDGYVAKLNSFDLCKNTGDYDGDAVGIYALLTDEAQEQAQREMCPMNTKSMWFAGGTANKTIYSLEQDAMLAIYTATKE